MSMIPNTRVSPAASRNSISPNCSPFSDCSTISIQDMKRGGGNEKGEMRRGRFTPPLFSFKDSLFHRTFLNVGVAAVLEYGSHGLVDQAPLRILPHHAEVVVLNRVLVAVELERAAHRLELRRLERLSYAFRVLDPALHLPNRGVDEERRVVALRGVYRWKPLVLLFELRDELLVGGVVEVERPVRGVEGAEHGIAHRADDVLIGRKTGCNQLHVL